MKRRVAVIGAGSWGTALAIVAARAGHDVDIWSRNTAVIESINREHVNSTYLNDALIPSEVEATGDITKAVAGKELVILAAPSHATRELLATMTSALTTDMIIVSATKGIEIDTGKRISQIVAEVVPEESRPRFACLSGPSFAKEVVANHPTAVVAASEDREARRIVQQELSFDNLRLYTNDDVIGTELGGSVKNVMAIAAGMVAGLGFGTNSIAALITRGLAEMTRLALSEGAKLQTMMGLAGLGDLVLTCTGSLSRNRFVGQELGNGRSLKHITATMNEVAEGVKTTLALKRLADRSGVDMPITNEVHAVLYEGVKTTLAVKRLADRSGVDMPITNEVHAVLYEGKSASDAANELMTRPLREESNE